MSDHVWRFKTARFVVELTLSEPFDLDTSWMDPAQLVDFAAGRLVAFDSMVRVTLDGLDVGSDHLGESVYYAGQVKDFWQAHRDPDPMNRNCTLMIAERGKVTICHYFPEMVRQAVAMARETLANQPELRKSES